jgi:mannan endo-1,4-beta-mannosidase
MKKAIFILIIFGGVLMLQQSQEQGPGFINVNGKQFIRDGKPYYFLGTNFWYGMNLGSSGQGGDRDRLLRELDHLKKIGVKNLRVMGASEGPDTEPWRMRPALQVAPGEYNEEVLDGLDFLLAEMGKRDMVAIMCMNNFWPWSGGMAQYVSWQDDSEIPYPPICGEGDWQTYQEYTASFYSNENAVTDFFNHLRFTVLRENPYTGTLYRDDPTIMAWQLGNEPRGINNREDFTQWIENTAKYIKSMDSNHLVTIGSEGATAHPSSGNDFFADHQSSYIDYTTIHVWVQNWGWFDPYDEVSLSSAVEKATAYINQHEVLAEKLNKPVVLEEFGISRDDNDHAVTASVTLRDEYYSQIFTHILDKAAAGSPLAGLNFWAWGGAGRPREPQAIWYVGDDFTGDPPHEHQGWYSVYNTDLTTLEIIGRYTRKFNSL